MSFDSSISEHNRDHETQNKRQLMSRLKTKLPHYHQVLDLFNLVLNEREKYRAALSDVLQPDILNNPALYELRLNAGVPVLDKNDIEFDNRVMAEHMTRLIRLLHSAAPGNSGKYSDPDRLNPDFSFKAFLAGKQSAGDAPVSGNLTDFLIDEMLHPILEFYAEKIRPQVDLSHWDRGFCPVCGEFPVMAALSNDSGKRNLISLSCGTEWSFSRVKCPFCDNTDQDQLSYLYIENDSRYRIETCDRCGRYLKTVDLRQSSLPADFELENIVTLHLDLIARENGYVSGGADGNRRNSEMTAAAPLNPVYH